MAQALADDWQSERSLVQCNKYMLVNQIGCDVTFQVGSQHKEKVSAHKIMLAKRSSVFSAMFYGSLPESNTIAIPDIEPEDFSELIKYIYTDDLNMTGNNVCALLYAANKYNIKNLKVKCSSFLQNGISIDNACTIMENSHIFSVPELFQKCKTFILENSSEVLMTCGLIDLCLGCLKSIISSDELYEKECDIFNVVMVWAENQCNKKKLEITSVNKRDVLGDVLYEIRFPLMDARQFTAVADTEILTQYEQVGVFKVISKGKSRSTIFKSDPRSSNEQICILRHPQRMSPKHTQYSEFKGTRGGFASRFHSVNASQTQRKTDTMTLAASTDVTLKGIILQPKCHFSGIIEISCSYSDNTCVKEPTMHPQHPFLKSQQKKEVSMPEQLLFVPKLGESKQGRCVHVHLLNPFSIRSGRTYTLKANVCENGTGNWFHENQLCSTFENTSKIYRTIQEIPSNPNPPFKLENETYYDDDPSVIVGLSYRIAPQ